MAKMAMSLKDTVSWEFSCFVMFENVTESVVEFQGKDVREQPMADLSSLEQLRKENHELKERYFVILEI